VEGELAFYHGKSCRAANPDSYADYSYAHAHANYSYAHATDPHAYPYDSYAYAYAHDSHAHPNAPGCCPVRAGAVVLQHAGAELLRE
jgi:hypothetical protein